MSPPWAATSISVEQVPEVLLTQWRSFGNRNTCAALTLSDIGEVQEATVRSADLGRGWGIAYDKSGMPGSQGSGEFCPSCGRGVFGIGGIDPVADVPAPGPWSFNLRWSDGSEAGHGGVVAPGEAQKRDLMQEALRKAFKDPDSWSGPVTAEYVEGGPGGRNASITVPWSASLTIPSQSCRYQLWSFLGKEHLETLIHGTRFVKDAGAP